MEVLYPRCAGLDVHKDMVVACLRVTANGTVGREVRTVGATNKALLDLSEWLLEGLWRRLCAMCLMVVKLAGA